jgi:ankyrin repeat protein
MGAVAELAAAHPEFVNTVDAAGRTLLQRAVGKGNLGMVKLLVAVGAELQARAADGSTALCIAAKGDEPTVRWLGLRGADANMWSRLGVTRLLAAF